MTELQMKVLRPDVRLGEDGDQTSISFAHWQVDLPSEVIQTSAPLLEFIRTRRVQPHLLDESGWGLVALLEAQGCFLPALPDRLTARSVLKLFQPLRSQLYADYYGHPAWARLQSGRASRGELAAWMVHNYHVSRSAGVIAARMAASTPDPELRAFFREDALGEYWHCDVFYFVEQSGIRLGASDVKSYVPLPASTAFEDHALRIAEENPLGHLLIAYFQESSIIFRQDSERFYDAVEANYGLSNTFVGWRKHMTLDMDHDHAGELEARFDDEKVISTADAAAAIRAVQLAQFFLFKALDQIAAHANLEDALTPRLPSSITKSDLNGPRQGGNRLTRSAGVYLLQAIRDGAFRALALARTHDQIIAAGRLASGAAKIASQESTVAPAQPWLIACRNFVIERAAEPDVLVDLAGTLVEVIAERCPELRGLVASIGSKKKAESASTPSGLAAIRLNELVELAVSDQPLAALSFVEN